MKNWTKLSPTLSLNLFFTPPQNLNNLVFNPKHDPNQKPPYVPTKHDKAMVRKGHVMLHLHKKFVDELLNLIFFFMLMKLHALQAFKQTQSCGDGLQVVKIGVPQHHKP
jgi:hypothetical protein